MHLKNNLNNEIFGFSLIYVFITALVSEELSENQIGPFGHDFTVFHNLSTRVPHHLAVNTVKASDSRKILFSDVNA